MIAAAAHPVPPGAWSVDGALAEVRVSGLTLRAERSGATVRIEVGGDLDPHNSRYLELVGHDALDRDGVRLLVLACTGVTFVGSNGLSALIELSRAADARAARLQIDRPSLVLRRLLDLAGLQRLLADR